MSEILEGEYYYCTDLKKYEVMKRNHKYYAVHFQGNSSVIRWFFGNRIAFDRHYKKDFGDAVRVRYETEKNRLKSNVNSFEKVYGDYLNIEAKNET